VDVDDEENTLFLREDRRYQLRSKRNVVTPKTIYIRVKSQPSEQLQSLLQASPESRFFVKESYQLAFGTEIDPPQTYFDFKRDTHSCIGMTLRTGTFQIIRITYALLFSSAKISGMSTG
jgi:hypothetical protein